MLTNNNVLNYSTNVQKQKKRNLILLILFIITILLLILNLFKNNQTSTTDNKTLVINTGTNSITNNKKSTNEEIPTITNTKMYVGETFNKNGIISPAQSISLYTHILTTGDQEYGLKSKNIDLNEYTGYVNIKGKIEDIKNIYIIQVEEIKSINNNDNNTLVISGNITNIISGDTKLSSNAYYLSDQMIYFDFKNNSGYKLDQINNKIIISTYSDTDQTGINLLNIEPFQCEKGNALTDCDQLKKTFQELQFDKIISKNGITFYKVMETNKWIALNNNLRGYYFYPDKDSNLTKLSAYINFITPSSIKNKLTPSIPNICKNGDISISKITNFTISQKNNEIIGEINGEDKNKNKLKCSLKIIPNKTYLTTLIDLKYTSSKLNINTDQNTSSEKINTNTTIPASLENNLENNLSTTVDTAEFDATKYMEYFSKRGFTIYLPKTVSFTSINLKPAENLEINGISCDMKINLINYKNKENLESAPDTEIYVCNAQIGDTDIINSLQNHNLIFKQGHETQNKFLIKFNSEQGQTYAQDILIK